MSRVNLNVPFTQKDQAKELGARWDFANKVWYVPSGMDLTPFTSWLPEELRPQADASSSLEFNIRAMHYFIVQSHTHCWRCKEITRVFSFLLPPEHELYEPEDDDGPGYWYSPKGVCIVSMVDALPPAVLSQMKRYTPNYRRAYSRTAGTMYFMNHCEQCNAAQGDFYMHNEPGGAFCPTDTLEAQSMLLYPIAEPFEGSGSFGLHSEDYFIHVMQVQRAR